MTTARSLTQRTAAGVAWTSAFQVTRQLLQVVSVSVLARHVPPAAYGLIAMAVLVTSFLETIRDAGTGSALIREREMSDDIASTAFWLNCAVGGVAALLVILGAWPAARFFHEPQIIPVLRVLSISFFLGALGVVPTALLNRAMEFKKLAVVQTAAAIIGTLIAIAVAIAGGKVWSLVAGTLSITFVTTVGLWILAPVRLKFTFHPDVARRILKFGLNLSGFHIFNYFSRNADNLLVGKFLGSAPLGFYQMGYMLMTYPLQNFTLMVTQVVYPGDGEVSRRPCPRAGHLPSHFSLGRAGHNSDHARVGDNRTFLRAGCARSALGTGGCAVSRVRSSGRRAVALRHRRTALQHARPD